MWHKNEGKPSPELPQQPAGGTTKSQVTPEPPAVSSVAPAPVTSAPVSIPIPMMPESSLTASRIHGGLKIHGEISGNSDLYIDGELQGKIRLGGARLVIGPNAKVQADIDAGAVTIDGTVQGNIKASEGVRLGAGSRVQGSVLTPRIGIDDGACLRGKVEMVKAGSSVSGPATTALAPRATESVTPRPVAAGAKTE
jgi:cytoskeletal protein CcmA (bactofilin family)